MTEDGVNDLDDSADIVIYSTAELTVLLTQARDGSVTGDEEVKGRGRMGD